MHKRNLFVRITAIVLCAIMILGVFTVALYAFAAEPTAQAAVVETGSSNNSWIIVAVVAAILVVATCIVVPRVSKKK